MSEWSNCKRKLSLSSSSEPSPIAYQAHKKQRDHSADMNNSGSAPALHQYGDQGQSFAMGPLGPMPPQPGPLHGPMPYGPWTSSPAHTAPHPHPPASVLTDHDINRIAIAVKSIMMTEIDHMVQTKVDVKYQTLVQCCNQLAVQNKELQNRIDDLEMYSRRSCVRIFGVPETNFDKGSTTEAILEIAEQIEVPLKAEDIVVSHRVGRIHKEDSEEGSDEGATAAPKEGPNAHKPVKPRPIIARINDYNLRHQLIKNSRNLFKGENISKEMRGVSINQDLTKTRSKLAYEARQMVKSEHAKATFVWDGKIFVIDNKENKHKITCLDDLIKVKTVLGLINNDNIGDESALDHLLG